MGAVVEIWFESLIPFLLKDSHIVHCCVKYIKCFILFCVMSYLRIAPLSKPEDKVKPGSRLLRPSKDNIILKSTLHLGYNTLFIHSIQQVIVFLSTTPTDFTISTDWEHSHETHPGAPCLSLPTLSGWSRWWCCCRVATLG